MYGVCHPDDGRTIIIHELYSPFRNLFPYLRYSNMVASALPSDFIICQSLVFLNCQNTSLLPCPKGQTPNFSPKVVRFSSSCFSSDWPTPESFYILLKMDWGLDTDISLPSSEKVRRQPRVKNLARRPAVAAPALNVARKEPKCSRTALWLIYLLVKCQYIARILHWVLGRGLTPARG
jgi:hypothetical protein